MKEELLLFIYSNYFDLVSNNGSLLGKVSVIRNLESKANLSSL